MNPRQDLRTGRSISRSRRVVLAAGLAACTLCALPAALLAVAAEPDGSIPEARSLTFMHGPVAISAQIGDGPFAGSTGDYDWYELTGLNGGWILAVDVNAEDFASTLDAIVYIYDSLGLLLATNDDFSSPNKDSFLEFVLPAGGTYYVVITASGCAPQMDPFDSSSGLCPPASHTQGPYQVVFGLSGVHP